ncbi:pectinesterase family protein [Holophaga foetida]|uniref:pectinesterase family protein n=1 Tax=Holophaga foetida TaxID=35839 RepID=UPI0011DDC6AD|nr:pectinesterase family protein [Holophaga foetida]
MNVSVRWSGVWVAAALVAVVGMTGCGNYLPWNDTHSSGAATGSPVLTLSPSATTYTAVAGADATTVQVTATKADGSADDFTVVSSPSDVVQVSKGSPSGTTTPVTLTPLVDGTAIITFTSGSDASLVRTLVATISPDYTDPTATYGLSSAQVFPAPAATTAYEDDRLTLTFDSTPTLGHGAIRIFLASDDTLVDRIELSGESDTLGLAGSQQRGVATSPIVINGNTVTLTPHSGKLVLGTQYYVGIPATTFTGATLNSRTFAGIGKAAGWTFTVRSSGPATGLSSLTVGPSNDTTVDFHTLQRALDYYMVNASVSNPVINLKNGTYRELLYLYNRTNLTIMGESRAGVILEYDNSEGLNAGSGSGSPNTPTFGGGRAVFLVENSDLLTLDTLTLKNTHIRSGSSSNSAEALFFRSSTSSSSSGHRLVARNANFYSEQNTLQLQGYTWFYNTKVSGNVDAIWGNNYVSLFELSTLETLGDSAHPATVSGYADGTGGSLVQPRTYPGSKGFVFAGCSLTRADGPSGVHVAIDSHASSYLARAAAGTWEDNVAFLNCKMDTHITAAGWDSTVAPSPSSPTASAGWREYNSMSISGDTLGMTGRSSFSKVLTAAEVSSAALGDYTQTTSYPSNSERATIFSAIGWAPVP